jgi:hypothetical protein
MENPLNRLIWQRIEELFYWNISPESKINQLPFNQDFLSACEHEFSMTVRGKHYTIDLGSAADWQSKTMGELAKEIDSQYMRNYFIGENGTSTTGVVGEVYSIKSEPITNKWNIRGKALVDRLRSMQKANPDLTVLDMGCGVNEYKKHLNNVTGVDPYRKEADILSKQEDFEPNGRTWDVIICFGPQNWYTYDEQYRNFAKLKECLSDDGILFWSHVHNYYKVFQPDAQYAHTWVHGDVKDAEKNSAFYFVDREWKYTWYFNWTEHALRTLTNHVELKISQLDYDHCNLYRPPMWRLFAEIVHKKDSDGKL